MRKRTVDEWIQSEKLAEKGPVEIGFMVMVLACPIGFLVGLLIGWAIWG